MEAGSELCHWTKRAHYHVCIGGT